MQPRRIRRPQGREPSGCDRHYSKSEPGLPDHCHNESHETTPHPAPQGREPSGGDRHDPKPDPGLPDYPYHGSMRPCPPCSLHVPRGHGVRGGRPALRTAPILSRAKTGSARGVPISRAFCAVLRRASQLETTATIPSGIQGAKITTITNLN